MTKPTLTPRQQEAKKLFGQKILQYAILGYTIFWGALIPVIWLLNLAGINIFTVVEIGATKGLLMGFLNVSFGSGVMLLAQRHALNAVRRAGLLDEESETVARTATTFEGEDMAFQYPSSPVGKIALIAAAASITALMFWFWRSLADDSVGVAMGAFGFALFLALTLLTIATLHQPNASVDERGVFGYRYNFIPTLVRWHEIESAHFDRMTGFFNNADVHTITLRNAENQTLLVFGANTFMGSPQGWREQFVAELKRRLTGSEE